MHIDYYREFIELARRLSFTEAAAHLYITQPALSKHISALEREFGAELFVRDRRNVQLSEAGRILYGFASNLVDQYDRTQNAINAISQAAPLVVDGVLYDNTVSSIISLSTVLLNDSHHPPIVFSHKDDAPFLDRLLNDEVDIVFAYDEDKKLDELGLKYALLTKNPFVAVLDKDHPLARRSEISIEELKDETFIQFIDEYSLPGWTRLEEVCRAHGFTPRKRPVFGRTVMGYATTPPDGGVLFLQQNLRQIKYLAEAKQLSCIPVVDPDAYFIIYYIYKEENEGRLRELLRVLEESREIISSHRNRSQKQ